MRVDRQADGLPTGVTAPPIWLQRELAERGGRISWFIEASPKARHGRREVRVSWALADPEQNAYVGSSGTHGTPWPHLRQIGAVERHRLQVRRGRIIATEAEVRYYVTSLAPEQADAKALLALTRGHWGIESAPRSAEGGHSTKESCQEWAVWLAGQAWGAEATPGLKLPRQCGGVSPSALVRC